MEGVLAADSQDCSQSMEVGEDASFSENEAWNNILKLLGEQGGAQSVFLCFKEADRTPEFHFWLGGVLDIPAEGSTAPWSTLPNGPEAAFGTVSLVSCPCDLSRAQALRSVGSGDLLEKAQAIAIAKEWRQWDVLQISREVSSNGLEGLFVEDFHIRLCALGFLLYLYWKQEPNLSCPRFLLTMARNIPTQYMGHSTRAEAMARAVSKCAALQCGVTPLSWLDIVLQVNGHGGSFGSDLQAHVLWICPEFARRINSWQHMDNLCTRVDKECYLILEDELVSRGVPKSILPQSWFRETFFLQHAIRRRKEETDAGLTAIEQICAVRRIVRAVIETWETSGHSLSQNGLVRLISVQQVRNFARMAKKYVEGNSCKQ